MPRESPHTTVVLPYPYAPDCLEKPSEKGYEQRLERGFGRHTEHERDLRVVCSATLQAPPTLFGQSRKANSAKLNFRFTEF
jgi:hypothetical protein